MAELRNDAGVLRFALEIAGREAGAPGGRLLVTAGLEYRDARDEGWWPVVRLPVLYLAADGVRGLAGLVAALVGGAPDGFAWRPEDDPLFGLQLGPVPGGAVAEIGVDLGAFLAEVAGAPHRPDAELGLFRFRASQADLVRFADGLAGELAAVGA
jgi:hypothetical protein